MDELVNLVEEAKKRETASGDQDRSELRELIKEIAERKVLRYILAGAFVHRRILLLLVAASILI